MSGRLLTGPRFGLSGGRGGFRTLVTDTFTRTDTTGPLGTADSGQAWETIAGTAFGITSNAAYNTDTANTCPNAYSLRKSGCRKAAKDRCSNIYVLDPWHYDPHLKVKTSIQRETFLSSPRASQ